MLVIVHEFGHFIVAKKSGIRVDEFGFGFPPKLFGVKKGETTYSFNAIPFGGFVKIFGENPDDNSINGPDKSRSLVHKPRYIQAAVMAAGVFFNLLLAWFLFSISFMSGMPASLENTNAGTLKDQSLVITSVLDASPANTAGLLVGDKIISLGTNMDSSRRDVSTPEEVRNFILENSGKEIFIDIKRNDELKNISVIPEDGLIEGQPAIGISMDVVGFLKLPFFSAIWEGLKRTVTMTGAVIVALVTLLKDAILGQADLSAVTGPVGIVGVVGDAYQFGFVYLLSFVAFISINLAAINLLPFPALDGGRLLFLLIEKIKGSRINPKIANTVNAIGFILLLLLMAIVTYRDIINLL